MNQYRIVTRDNGTFGVQRQGSTQVNGNFDTWVEAAEAIGLSQAADATQTTDKSQY